MSRLHFVFVSFFDCTKCRHITTSDRVSHTAHTHSQLLSTIFLSLQSDAGHITFIMCQLLVAQNLFISNYLLHLIAVCNEHGLYLYLYNGSSKLFLSCCYLLFVNVTKQCALSAVQYRFYVFHMDEPLLLNSTWYFSTSDTLFKMPHATTHRSMVCRWANEWVNVLTLRFSLNQLSVCVWA